MLSVKNLKVHFRMQRSVISILKKEPPTVTRALDGVTFDVQEGEVLGVVGETGCGKSTLAKTILLLNPITDGEVCFGGKRVNELRGKELMEYYSKVQLISQDPFSSLNPRMKVYEIISRPLVRFGKTGRGELDWRIKEMIKSVGLTEEDLQKYPHEFSGGGKQRIAIARSLISRPQFLIADEPTSSLDVSIQAKILNLLKDLRENLNLTMLFISHNLSVIDFISDKVAVMYFGRIVELLPKENLFTRNYHWYTKALIDSIPKGRKLKKKGSHKVKHHGSADYSEINYEGCLYYFRCPNACKKCFGENPTQIEVEKDHYVFCHFPRSAEK